MTNYKMKLRISIKAQKNLQKNGKHNFKKNIHR